MSSDDIAICVENLSKCYLLYDAPRDRLKQFIFPRIQRLTKQSLRSYYREFWALRNVSFEVNKGETIGIIGRNGSGKSTLLQIICGTLAATDGTLEINGRVAALLELGAGFNPDFTGRENVYVNGSVLGFNEREIDERFDRIAAFADIGDFIDQPVKTYSSGMYVRLAFAVAINVDPEILVVDEALSVGDEAFQRKCFYRIENIKEQGGTILFVSHSGSTVVELCDKAILLDSGEVLMHGMPKAAVSHYQRLIYAPKEKQRAIREEIRALRTTLEEPPARQPAHMGNANPTRELERISEAFDPDLRPKSTFRYVSKGAAIEDARIVTLSGSRVNVLNGGEEYIYTYRVRFTRSAGKVRFGMLIKTMSGFELGGAASASSLEEGIPFVEADSRYDVEFPFQCLLAPGTYFLNAGVVGIVDETEEYLDRILDVEMFRVMPVEKRISTGIVDFCIVPRVVEELREHNTAERRQAAGDCK